MNNIQINYLALVSGGYWVNLAAFRSTERFNDFLRFDFSSKSGHGGSAGPNPNAKEETSVAEFLLNR
jgi:hypothetical protein